MIDLHCHVLPGVDDGPPDLDAALRLARAASDAGVSEIVATPHVSWDYGNTAAVVAGAVEHLQIALDDGGVDIRLHPGAEVASTRAADLSDAELAALSLGGSGWLLLEPPFTASAAGLPQLIAALRERGHAIVLAHPERCPALHRQPELLASLVGDGVLCSVTAGALVGRFGAPVRRFAERMMSDGLVHNVASDAHDTLTRPPGISDALAKAGWTSIEAWACQVVPAALLAGEALPPRPATAAKRRRRWLPG
jgi:protein-tyrosine phosphatase